MKPIKQINPYEEKFNREILEFINNPITYEDQLREINDKILACCGRKVNLDYKYDGPSRCEISGKYLTEDDKISINGHSFSNIELQRQIQVGGIVDFSIDFIEIFNYEGNKIIELEFNEENLQKMYGDNLREMKLQSKRHFHEKQSDRDKNFQFECPITKKKHYTILEGIFYNNKLYSLEGIENQVGNDQSCVMNTSLRREQQYIEKLLQRRQRQQFQQQN